VIGMGRGGACSSFCDKLNRRSLMKGLHFESVAADLTEPPQRRRI